MWRTAAASETSGRPNRHFRRGLSEGGVDARIPALKAGKPIETPAQSRSRDLTDFGMERQLSLLLGVPLRLHLTPPFLWILFVHLPHVLGRLRMFLHDVRRHSLDHFVPGVGGHFLIAGAAQFSAGHRFQCRLLVPDNNGDIRLIAGRSAVGQRRRPSSETIGPTEMVQRDNPEFLGRLRVGEASQYFSLGSIFAVEFRS